MKEIKIAPSTHPSRENYLEYSRKLIDGNVDIIHCDIMDGNFVSDKTYDYNFVSKLKSMTTIPLDVHLMIKNADILAEKYVQAGANIVTFQYESFDDKNDIIKTLKKYRNPKTLVGISFNPDTKICDVEGYFPYVDLVLVMSVVTGASGQTFIRHTFDRLQQLIEIKDKQNLDFLIEVDGGINLNNINELFNYDIDILVVGSALFNAENFNDYYSQLKYNKR